MSSPYFDVQMMHGSINCYTAGLGGTDLSDTYKMRIVNPFDILYKYNEEQLVNRDGASPIMDYKLAARSIQLVGNYYHASYPYQIIYNLSGLADNFKDFNEDEASFLLLRLKDSAGWEDFRLHCKFQGMDIPMAEKTQLMATQNMIFNFRMHDPGIYRNTGSSKTCSVTSGSYSSTINNSGSRVPTDRVVIKIEKTSADTPTNVIVNIAGEQFLIADTLSSGYWFVDCKEGWVRTSDTRESGTNKISKFAGTFPTIPASAAAAITITDTASSDFTVYLYWLYRWF